MGMSMNHGLSENSMVATPQARVEWTTHGPRDMYLLYDQAHYSEGSTPVGWWQRTLALDPYHWFRLSGTPDISPWEAVCSIMREPDRPAFTLPALLVALFLARAARPNTLAQRQLFRWVAFALPQLRARLPTGSLQVGWNELSTETLDHSMPTIINVLLENEPAVPWVLSDGDWLRVLDHLGNYLWRFPTHTIREMSTDAAKQIDQCARAEEEAGALNRHASQLPPVTAIGYLSALRFWRDPWPTIRGLSIGTSMLEFLPLWHQVLLMMAPDAPAISHTDLAWLCDETLGTPSDAPFDHLIVAGQHSDTLGQSTTDWQARITELRQEAARGTWRPRGCWEVPCAAHWPVFSTYNVARMRVVAGPHGCWVRLIPVEEHWGSVLWWRPQPRVPTWWSLALGEACSSVSLLAFHATFWQLWRDIRVEGHPAGQPL